MNQMNNVEKVLLKKKEKVESLVVLNQEGCDVAQNSFVEYYYCYTNDDDDDDDNDDDDDDDDDMVKLFHNQWQNCCCAAWKIAASDGLVKLVDTGWTRKQNRPIVIDLFFRLRTSFAGSRVIGRSNDTTGSTKPARSWMRLLWSGGGQFQFNKKNKTKQQKVKKVYPATILPHP
ncbi:hypothetical protein T11_3526 [Trichinella zimbabwensis]|uniref:Uncharacterized protein n=1 Tax=Trichinella zimbabwensis TaxID=268475 RepID=A0A0V1HCU8_9BILA|nr:hypothetical protein T11_3526 [Trichinella zimbabwensis]